MSRVSITLWTSFLLMTCLCVPAPAFADTVTILPAKDNTLYEPIAPDGFADKSDGAGPTLFAGKVKDADADPGPGTRPALRRGVLAFNIAGNIPAGAAITGVQLTLYADKVAVTTSYNLSLHRLLSDWGEPADPLGVRHHPARRRPDPLVLRAGPSRLRDGDLWLRRRERRADHRARDAHLSLRRAAPPGALEVATSRS